MALVPTNHLPAIMVKGVEKTPVGIPVPKGAGPVCVGEFMSYKGDIVFLNSSISHMSLEEIETLQRTGNVTVKTHAPLDDQHFTLLGDDAETEIRRALCGL